LTLTDFASLCIASYGISLCLLFSFAFFCIVSKQDKEELIENIFSNALYSNPCALFLVSVIVLYIIGWEFVPMQRLG
jgi:hypothetical protein